MSQLSAEEVKDDPPVMYEHRGVYFSDKNVARETLHLMPEWQARKDDVFVVTYPKAGNRAPRLRSYSIICQRSPS